MAEKSLEEKVQRALDYQEIQNVMSKHCYYHSAGMHREELENIWAQKTPGVRWTNPAGVWEEETIKKFYVDEQDRQNREGLEKLKKVYPDVEVTPENYGMGVLNTHPAATPCIEVAGDGKTAKGVWVSPGQVTGIGDDGNPQAKWMWGKYAIDFVKEDGKWKIWHLQRYYDFAVPVNESWADPRPEFESHKPMEVDRPAPVYYKPYSAKTVPQYLPVPPEPYETFDEKTAY